MGIILSGRDTGPVTNSAKAAKLSVLSLAFTVSCTTAEKPKTESTPALVAQTERVQPAAKVSAPQHDEVKEAVRRVFKDSVTVDPRRKPFFVDGDFNGDDSRDLAVVIIPAANKLAELNQEVPNWILKDPLSGAEPQIPRLRIAADETLLAVIHGYGASGWRHAQATQTFLLKNAVGSGMTAHQARELITTNKTGKTPYLRGDVIGGVVNGSSGYLYFAGATYSWFDPKTFQPDSNSGVAHMRANRKKR